MSETPPSIPPRKRPTTPVTGGGARPAAGSGSSGGSSEQGSSWSTITGTTPPTTTVDDGAGRSTGGRGDDRPRADQGARAAEVRRSPAPTRPAGEEGDGPEPPSPLVTAVDATTTWLRKAAERTGTGLSKAYSQVTRPRTEDDATMSTTPTTSATKAAERPAPRSTAPVTGATARPATGRIPSVGGGPRRVRLAVSRVDPWSVMKLAFLLSVAIGIMIVVAAVVVWFTLDGLHVFATIDDLIKQVVGDEDPINILQYVSFQRTVSAATLVAVIDVFLLTALATIGAFLYNIVAALVGGVHVTMTDE